MKIYISGKISGLPFDEVKATFQEKQNKLERLGFEVFNPTQNGLPQSNTWEQHMAHDIDSLFQCDAIYMLEDWENSKGARIENYIATITGKDVYFESYTEEIKNVILRIQNAILQITGMNLSEYSAKSRKRERFFSRMLFAYHCRRNFMTLKEIGWYVKRDHTSIVYMLKKYPNEIKYNKNFKNIAKRVEDILKN